MFDVPPPERLKGLQEYEKTWDLFYRWHRPGDAFNVREMDVTAGDTVAFASVQRRRRIVHLREVL